MNENDLRNDIMKTAKVYEWFGKEGIINITKEFLVGYNKSVDLLVETEKSFILIEIKIQLSSYDIGQIITYMTAVKFKTNKKIKGVLLYNKSTCLEKELTLLTLKNYNIDIMLIEYNRNDINTIDNIDIDITEKYNKVVEIIKKLKPDKVIMKNVFTKKYNIINENEWRTIREMLKQNDIIYIDSKKRIFKKQIRT
ncbi:MAG: hypothetical protein PVG30_02380 [Gammaproteobacteria bacterium]|jgi:hypothetical protein